MNINHRLKCWPKYFEDIWDGRKSFDVRNGNDRIYCEGDGVMLEEWDPVALKYTGRSFAVRVTYVMHGPPFLPGDLWVLGLSKEA